MQRIRDFVESQSKWTEHHALSPAAKWTADDIARYLLQRTLDQMERLRASKQPLTSTLPKPEPPHSANSKRKKEQITVPPLHGMADATKSPQIWKDLERHFVADIVVVAQYLPLFVQVNGVIL